MEKINKRLVAFGLVVATLFILLVVQLGSLTLVPNEADATSGGRSIRKIVLKGERGKILDRNGQVLAYNKKSYNIQFLRNTENRTETGRALDTHILWETIRIIEAFGGTTIDTFNIYRREPGQTDENGNPLPEYYFYWGPGLSEEAQAKREENWRTNMNVGTKRSVEEIYNYLRRVYQIPEEMPYEDARKLLSIWQEIQLLTWRSYIPVTIAYNVSAETVAAIETRSDELAGMSASESVVRMYPKSTTAAHTIGYMGKMQSDTQIEALTKLGYSTTDLIGISGVEATMEEYLTGNTTEHQGSQRVEVDSSGKIIRVLDVTTPSDGDDVVLTLDLELQQVAETALEKNIAEIRRDQETHLAANLESYQKMAPGGDVNNIDLCDSGSAVVIDCKTGELLALVNSPSYDLNLFTGGISATDYQALLDDERNPLFNKAVASKMAPGSVFKMAIALAALEEGAVRLDEIINDEGYYTTTAEGGSKVGAPKCWVYPNISKHQDQDVIKALKDSCNYYFFECANRLGIDRINDWCSRLGLNRKTGIEVNGEATGQIGGQKVLFDSEGPISGVAYLVYRNIVSMLTGYLERLERTVDKATIESCAEKLVRLVNENTQIGSDIRRIMREELGIAEAVSSSNGWSSEISSALSELRWNPMQTVRTGMGQAVVSVTPVEIARYVASLVNGGNVLELSVIKSIIDASGATVKEFEPNVLWNLNAKQENLDAIKEGMREVVSLEDGGTASKYFADYKYRDQIGGKTGSAQISASDKNIDLQNTAWFVAFAPYDDPEIVVVVSIPNGWAGARAYITIQEVVQFYLDRKTASASENLTGTNELLP
ncbi:MAG: penicillin-binding transpeptidase domain-containing protein [Christensenellales bacterium]|jgi:penicillin-binding protein 2